MNEVPFDVTDEIDVVDLTEVKEDRSLTPACKGLRVRISKAAVQASKDGDIKSLKLTMNIVEGIKIVDKESGVEELKYVNKPLFTGLMDLVVWADKEVKERSTKTWWKNNQHLVGLSGFCKALDLPLKGLKVTDEFLQELIGRELLVDIVHEAETMLDPTTGKREKTGTMRDKIKNFKKAS